MLDWTRPTILIRMCCVLCTVYYVLCTDTTLHYTIVHHTTLHYGGTFTTSNTALFHHCITTSLTLLQCTALSNFTIPLIILLLSTFYALQSYSLPSTLHNSTPHLSDTTARHSGLASLIPSFPHPLIVARGFDVSRLTHRLTVFMYVYLVQRTQGPIASAKLHL